ncbi:AraC family transcriptional regulator [Streptomyces piniterrae]|uniref:AraC family transcriptional regulator n=1 Tax=Streptomyces piniterrae TaxID=2571125 RepID=A0A4U0NVF9_9ACTN|nr:AraC family transcriptional regulator [Streptomyces piniterrae]TJZ58669.1 AraC family transcriptional regulator [Streptomyces piniterrae]
MDVLSDAITAMRAGRPHAARKRRHGAWGLRFPATAGVGFHAVSEGSCWLLPEDGSPPIQLTDGDLAFVHGIAYGLADDPGTPLVEVVQNPDGSWPPGPATPDDGTPGTLMLCGAYRLNRARPHPLLACLPGAVRLPTHDRPLGAVLDLLRAEMAGSRPGAAAATSALLDTALLYILRAWYDEHAQDTAGWGAALHDPAIGRALSAIHHDPAHPWTVEELGTVAGLSRAAFAKRFTALVGEPPLGYLTWWRLTLAGRLLREGDQPLRVIAQRTGYASEFAFAKAFKREYGTAPGRYRTQPSARLDATG